MNTTRIAIVGIGGVGGYFGGLLAAHYKGRQEVDVIFIARGRHLDKVKQAGLQLVKGQEVIRVEPDLATDNPSDVGVVDILLLCTKTYDLDEVASAIRPCLGKETVILPLLNGTDNAQRIRKYYPDNLILDGCVYLQSRLSGPGVIQNVGTIEQLYFGLDNSQDVRLRQIENILRQARVDVHYSSAISSVIWEKFIFVSSVATATTLFDKNIGELLADESNVNTLVNLINEVQLIAEGQEVELPINLTDKVLSKLNSLTKTATSSMHTDFRNNSPKNEMETMTRFVVKEGKRLGIDTQAYRWALEQLEIKALKMK